MADILSIVNRALLQTGSRTQISSLSEGSIQSNTANVLYQPTFEALARAAYWNCLRKQAVLTLLAAAAGTPENPTGTTMPVPPFPWLYSYQVPSDSLRIRFIVPVFNLALNGIPQMTGNTGIVTPILATGAQIPFVVSYDTDSSGNPREIILCNQSQSQAVYTVNQPNPQLWDSQFQAAMVASLSVYFIQALNMNMPLLQGAVAQAQRMIDQARISDGNEGTQSQSRQASWISARGRLNNIPFYGVANYDNMSFPVF
jgi:hypothetical protein